MNIIPIFAPYDNPIGSGLYSAFEFIKDFLRDAITSLFQRTVPVTNNPTNPKPINVTEPTPENAIKEEILPSGSFTKLLTNTPKKTFLWAENYHKLTSDVFQEQDLNQYYEINFKLMSEKIFALADMFIQSKPVSNNYKKIVQNEFENYNRYSQEGNIASAYDSLRIIINRSNQEYGDLKDSLTNSKLNYDLLYEMNIALTEIAFLDPEWIYQRNERRNAYEPELNETEFAGMDDDIDHNIIDENHKESASLPKELPIPRTFLQKVAHFVIEL